MIFLKSEFVIKGSQDQVVEGVVNEANTLGIHDGGEKGWIITHIKSGFRINTKVLNGGREFVICELDQAKAVVAKLMKCGINWSLDEQDLNRAYPMAGIQVASVLAEVVK